jgi:hypothetical protein
MQTKGTRWALLLGAAVLGLTVFASVAGAFSLRSPQVSFSNASLQSYLNANDGGINTLTDQLDAQVWASSVSGNATFTLQIELAGNAASNNIGVYNANGGASPPLYQVFPGAASAGWFATCHFAASGALTVLLFDNNAVFQGSTGYSGVNRNSFGFYLQGPGGLFYSEDYRNASGNPQVLTYGGTGVNFGDWWECFEDLPFAAGSGLTDFEDAVLLLQSVIPTPSHGTTWGQLKKLYR